MRLNTNSESSNWYAVYTKSRHEKRTRLFPTRRGVTTFLPMRNVLSRWKVRRKLISLPLFPTYIFVHIGLQDLPGVFYSKDVSKIIGINGKPYSITPKQTESIMRPVNSDLRYDPHPYIDIGQKVVIRNGPLQSVVGKILDKRSSKHIVILAVDLIKRAVSVEVNIEDIEPL